MGDVTVNNLQQDVETGQNALFVIQLSSTDKKPSCIDQCPSGSLLEVALPGGTCNAGATPGSFVVLCDYMMLYIDNVESQKRKG